MAASSHRRRFLYLFFALLIFLICTGVCAKKKEDKKDEKQDTKPKKKKDIRDYDDADMERLFQEWEEKEDEHDPDDLLEHERPAQTVDLSQIDPSNPESALKLTKKGKTLMMFVTVSGSPTQDESDTITNRWQSMLFNANYQLQRYPVSDNRVIFLLKDGSLAWEIKNFLIEQDRCQEVSIEGQTFYGKGSGKKVDGKGKLIGVDDIEDAEPDETKTTKKEKPKTDKSKKEKPKTDKSKSKSSKSDSKDKTTKPKTGKPKTDKSKEKSKESPAKSDSKKEQKDAEKAKSKTSKPTKDKSKEKTEGETANRGQVLKNGQEASDDSKKAGSQDDMFFKPVEDPDEEMDQKDEL